MTRNRNFGIGDVVTICMLTNDIFPFQTSPRIEHAEIVHYPADTGDDWRFMLLESGEEFTINPLCSAFAGLVHEPHAEPEPLDEITKDDDLPFG